MRYTCTVAIALALSALGAAPIFGQSPTSYLSIPANSSSYQLVSFTRVSRSQSYYTYQAILVNTGAAIPAVTATVTSLNPGIVIVPGEGTVHFSPVPAKSEATSIDTFTILLNGTPFDGSELQWSFLNPVANPGPNQTVPVDSTVTLNASASTNPSGIGSLTYGWTLLTAPPGSAAALSNANTMIATFVPDVSGTYTVRLTVNNGTGSDSEVVTISTENSAPVANAGPNQTVALGTTVQLNGGTSSDPDGNPLRYFWTLVSLPVTSTAALSNPRAVAPSFVVDVAGTYIIQLVVNDGNFSSPPSTVKVTTGNTPPVASAGPNQRVNLNALVQLNGSASTDVNGNALTYLWSLNTTQAPGSKATLSNPTAVNPTFTADVPGIYVAQLIVNDGISNSQPATVTISTNAVQAPTANAGPPQSVAPGATVTLDGSGSSDPQGLPLTYTWSLITRPASSVATLSADNIVKPTFVADQSGTYVAQLTVSNGYLSSTVPATVTITTADVQPIAIAGTNQSVFVGTTVTLDGSQSYDPDNEALTYSWAFLAIPAGSNVALIGATTVNPTFVTDVVGTYVVQLIVSDPSASSNPSTVTITAGSMTISLSPDPLTLNGVPGILTVGLNPPTGANPVSVNLTGYNPAVISFPPGNVTVPPNSSGVNVTVTPVAAGTTQVIAYAPGYQPAASTVTAAALTISVAFQNNGTAVGLTHSIGGIVTLSAPAPASGTLVALSSDPLATGQVSFNPSSVTILPGNTTGTFTLTGVALGPTTITASASGYNSGTMSVLVVSLGGISISQGLVVPFGQSVPLNVQISTPAPIDGTTVTLISSNPAILGAPPSVNIAPGATTPSPEPQVTGIALGSTTLIAVAGGYSQAVQLVNVVGAITLSPANISVTAGGEQNINIVLSAPAPPGGVLVNLSSSNTSVATVPASVIVSGLGMAVPVTGAEAGSATITASSSSALFSASAASVSVTVN